MSPSIKTKKRLPIAKIKETTRYVIFYLALLCFLLMVLSRVSAQDTQADSAEKPVDIEVAFPPGLSIDNTDIYFAAFQVNQGEFPEKILNPKCVDRETLIKDSEEYKTIERERLASGTAKYWILIAKASENAAKSINRFATEQNLNFLCDREALIVVLQKTETYKDCSETELIKTFDITSEILAWIRAKNKAKEH